MTLLTIDTPTQIPTRLREAVEAAGEDILVVAREVGWEDADFAICVTYEEEEESAIEGLKRLLPLSIKTLAANVLEEFFTLYVDGVDPIVAEAATKLAEEYKQRLEEAKADDHV